MSIEVPKPKDWQTFQRNCTLLFRYELNDPNVLEYGRSGQNQGGIDIIACRNGDTAHYVGVQCRHIALPLKKKKILEDARAVIELKLDLKELIFATTAPDDTKATKAAIEVERELAASGHTLRIVVLGWEQMQKLICLHDVAYHAFHPAAVSTSAPVVVRIEEDSDLTSSIAAQVVERLRASNLATPPLDTTKEETAEDPPLHARIDTLRDLFKEQALPLQAQKGLEALLSQDLTAKPWARYRIETILASIELDLGKEKDSAKRFRLAFSLQPNDSKALANLALAQTIDGEYAEAMDTARKALSVTPPEEHAVSVLLQAAARSGWRGNPEELIPANIRGSVAADFGLAEFLRRTESTGWQARCIELAARYPDRREFKLVRAIAVLDLVVENPERPSIGKELIASAAEDLRAIVDRFLSIGFAHPHDLIAHVNNASLLLRFSGRHADSETLLLRGIAACGADPQLRRLLAIARFNQSKIKEAIQTLDGDNDPENVLLRAEFLSATSDYKTSLNLAQSIADDLLPPQTKWLRWNLLGELALAMADWSLLDEVIQHFRQLYPDKLIAELLELRKLRRLTNDRKAVQETVTKLIGLTTDETSPLTRFNIASEAYNSDLPAASANLLERHVDLQQASPPTFLYLESLATARLDTRFRSALDLASDEVRHGAGLQWVVATHAWNRGDLDASLAAIDQLLNRHPDHAAGRLLKIEVLMRQDKSAAVLAELDTDLERLPWKTSRDEFRLASLLSHFGYVDRAAALAYRLFLKHRDLSRAWMTFSSVVLDIRTEQSKPPRWLNVKIGPDSAVDLRYDDGTTQFFVVESSAQLRSLDESSWEPSHKLAAAVRGLTVGSRFTGPDGRAGLIAQVRHKYVARLHYVLENYEKRFPTIFGVKQVPVDVEREGGLDHMIAELQARRDYVSQEAERYSKGHWPLEAFAKRIGSDPIDAAHGLTAHGHKLNVAVGVIKEREHAHISIVQNKKRGCVLDLFTFWTAHRLGVLDAIHDTCGRVHLPQSVVDRLRQKRGLLEEKVTEGASSAHLVDGKFALVKTAPETIAAARDDLASALQWITERATVMPVELSEELPAALREVLRKDNDALFASVILATHHKLLFITDDLPIRQIAQSLGAHGTWLHMVLCAAADAHFLEFDKYVLSSSELALAGHNFLSLTGDVIARAAALESIDGSPPPGPRTIALAGLLGGKAADRHSHTAVAIQCFRLLWSDPDTNSYRRPVTSEVLRSLTRQRVNDCYGILDDIEHAAFTLPALLEYISAWRIGHFLTRTESP
jgi:tetratricopeptide (TPR) repeat protein